MPATIYLATCAELPDGDEEDGAALLEACARAGLAASWQAWDDPGVDWARADLVVIRATWDYTPRLSRFLEWAAGVPSLANRAEVIQWNSDKRYLADLVAAGIPIVPTAWAGPGEAVELPVSGEYVVKPSVGAGSRGAARFTAGRSAATTVSAHIASLHAAGRTVMVQPYLDGVDTAGETALVFIGGEYSHAIRKGAMLTAEVANAVDGEALYVPESISVRQPDAAQRRVAEQVLAAAPVDLLYARVDLLPGPDGPVLVELELTEPSLFLSHDAAAADRLAAAIAARAGR